MKKKSAFFAFVLVFATIFFIGSFPVQSQAKPVVLKMVMFLPNIPPGNIWSNIFMENVKTISKGDLIVKLIGGPEAIPPMDAPTAAINGVVDIANAMTVFVEGMLPGIDAVGRSEYSPAELRKRGFVEFLCKETTKFGLYYLGASSASEAQQQTALYFKKEVKTLNDFKGIKIASPGGSHRLFLEGLGATVVPIDFSDYFTAMERGLVDGYNIGIPGIQDFGLTPVTKYMLDEPFGSCAAGFFVNLKRWNSLSQKHKDMLTKAAIKSEIDGANAWEDVVAKVKADISAEGVKIIFLSKEDSVNFYKEYREKMSAMDLNRNPEFVSEVHKFTMNPNFYRLK